MVQPELNKKLPFNNQQIKKFARQLILENFGWKKQSIIFKSHITFIGLGGINLPAIIYLLSIGIKKLTLIDYDKVQWSNLNRQIIYSQNDIGKNKIDCVKKFIKKYYPKVEIIAHNKKINKKNSVKIFKKTDLMIDGTDNWETMLTVNDYCLNKSIPLLSASVVGFDGNLILFKNLKNNHLCLRCIFPNFKEPKIPRCETVGILGTTAGIIGILSAHKIVNFLTNKKKFSKKTVLTYFDGQKIEFKDIKVKKNPKCIWLKK